MVSGQVQVPEAAGHYGQCSVDRKVCKLSFRFIIMNQ